MRVTQANDIRILIADDDNLLATRLERFLSSKGFHVRAARTGSEAMKLSRDWKPTFVFYDLMLPEVNALEFLRQVKAASLLGDDKMSVFVISGHNDPQNVRQCIQLGATEYIAKPYRHADILARVVLHLRPKREVSEYQGRSKQDFESAHYFLHLTDLTMCEALKGGPTTETLHNLTGMIGHSLDAVRVSVTMCELSNRKGLVIASNDKRSIEGIELDLAKYPEILYVLNNDKMLAIDNLAADPTMHFVTLKAKSIHFNSLIVVPIRIWGKMWGVLSVRLSEAKKTPLSEFELRYVQLTAHVMAMVIAREEALCPEKPSQNSGGSGPFRKTA